MGSDFIGSLLNSLCKQPRKKALSRIKVMKSHPRGALTAPVLGSRGCGHRAPADVFAHTPSVLRCLLWVLAPRAGDGSSDTSHRGRVSMLEATCVHTCLHLWCMLGSCSMLASCSPKDKTTDNGSASRRSPQLKAGPSKTLQKLRAHRLPAASRFRPQTMPEERCEFWGGPSTCPWAPFWSHSVAGPRWVLSPHTVLPPGPMAHRAVLDLLLPPPPSTSPCPVLSYFFS